MLSSVMEKGTVLRFWLDALVPKGQINKKPVESLEVEQKLSKSMNQKKQRESP